MRRVGRFIIFKYKDIGINHYRELVIPLLGKPYTLAVKDHRQVNRSGNET